MDDLDKNFKMCKNVVIFKSLFKEVPLEIFLRSFYLQRYVFLFQKFESIFATLQKVSGIKQDEFDACRASIDALISAQTGGDSLTMRELDSTYMTGKTLPK